MLVNGRRAGTANLSKLSPAEIERVEIVRGPASVVYGSQALGGVVNLILRDGRTFQGGAAELRTGSWGLAEGRFGYGTTFVGGDVQGGDFYAGFAGGRRDSYRAGGSGDILANTQWNRLGALAALGVNTPIGRVGTTLRTDGTYDSGFRGSAWNTTNREDRTNMSADVFLDGGTEDARLRWSAQLYAVRDVDRFFWRSPVQRSAAGLPVPGTDSDNNRRTLDIYGLRLQPSARPWRGATLLVGLDLERSTLDSTRNRRGLPGSGITAQVPPMDNNQTDRNLGLYAELSQRLFADRLTLRGGARQTWGETEVEATPFQPLLRLRSADYDSTTWSAGASLRATDSLVLRANASTGFRAPTATELAADFTALGGGRTFGNPNLRPETSLQYEAGAALFRPGLRADLALYQNTISDRIVTLARRGVANTSDWSNNPGDIRVRGVELQLQADLARFARLAPGWRWTAFANGAWNFEMVDEGKRLGPLVNTRTAERMHRYLAAIGTTVGQARWDASVIGVLRGTMHYDTEENLRIPAAEPFREFVHRKGAVWVWNLRASAQPIADRPNLRVFGAVNNLFDENHHPIFVATASAPFLGDARFANGGFGNSAPGREFLGGLRVTF